MQKKMPLEKDDQSPRSDTPSMSTSDQQIARSELEQRGVLVRFNEISAPLGNSIFGSAACLYEFFHLNGYAISRADWDAKTISPELCCYVGWVYAFYGEEDVPIYVGETGRTFTKRFEEHINKQCWWPCWTRVKVLPCPNQTMRKVFESLIGLAGGYQANKMQPAGGDNILDEVILSLLVLGNERKVAPTFPNEMIWNQMELLCSNFDTLDGKY